MIRRLWGASLMFTISCSAAAPRSDATAPPQPSGHPVTALPGAPDTLPIRSRGVADTDRELWPDPRDRTEVRLEVLRGFLRDYLSRTGRLPERLQDAVPADPRPFTVHADAWENPFRYVRSDASYELGSAGPDGRWGTADDIVVTLSQGTKWGDPEPSTSRPAKSRPAP